MLAPKDEYRIGVLVGVKISELDEVFDQSRIDSAFRDQVMSNGGKPAWLRHRQFQVRLGGCARRFCMGAVRKMIAEPCNGAFEVQSVEVDDQVDGPAPAGVAVPVHELAPGDRDHSLGGMPPDLVVGVQLGVDGKEHGWQGDAPGTVSLFTHSLKVHTYG